MKPDEEGGFTRLRSVERKTIKLSWETVTKVSYLNQTDKFPLLIEPCLDDVNLARWAEGNREQIEKQLLRHGAILFRGFNVDSAQRFDQFITAVSERPQEYRERSSPRSQVSGNIYTSTDYPPDKSIFLHNEQSYNLTFPLRIFFFCMTPARDGGQTPIANTRRIYQRLDHRVRDRFAESNYMYVRNFGDGFGLSWQSAFQTSDRRKVEEYCANNNIKLDWKSDDRLRTRQVRRVIARHPRSFEEVWFNHIVFFHISTLDDAIQQALLAQFSDEDLPNNTYYGDGSRIEPSVLDELREAYLQEKVVFPWQAGDILMLDNMLAAHGREPYTGLRQVFVGMTEQSKWENV